ncbi:protein spire-like [Ctenocephalides felis]|uniref:protein spire-like n=1 Tax=Ctenocephalides felis TaxID=7515 RepID=UPI000E6E500D|nr:protein spire-like [Ctenocephalides felis]
MVSEVLRQDSILFVEDSHNQAAFKRDGLASGPNSVRPVRRPIKADFSILQMNDSDDDDDENDSQPESPRDSVINTTNPWKRTAYDLATQCSSRRASMRRHTIVACGGCDLLADAHTENVSQTNQPPADSSSICTDGVTSCSSVADQRDRMSWSTTSLQDELMPSQWQDSISLDERLSLTLEEIVHIRSVLTKAELEGLPVECRVKADAEKRKVCFLCLKTRFGIFGPWGQRCKLCKRTVCAKCYSKMRIPTEHFRNVPVVLLSPSVCSPCTSLPPTAPCSPHRNPAGMPMDDSFPRRLMARLLLPENERKFQDRIGSAPCSPNRGRNSAPDSMTCSTDECPKSTSPRHQTMDQRFRSHTSARSGTTESLRGELMIVCHDCRSLVIEIIRASRLTRSALRNHTLRNLTLDLTPIYNTADNNT